MPLSPRSISIVLCTFNGARFLEDQLRSLREQAGVDEIVVVDDGSTDETAEILRAHAAGDERLKVTINDRRLGVVENFERAIRRARCPWVALADQDDVWLPGKLAALAEAWNGRAVLLHHATHKFGGEIPCTLRSPAGERRKFSGGDVRRLLYRNSIVGHTTLVRAEVVERLMPFPRGVPHDWWIGAGAAVLGPVQYVDEYLVHYRIHGGNAYHRAGSRWARLRAEHEMRLNLLTELGRLPTVAPPVRAFVRHYRDQLRAAETTFFSWALWRFYRRHAERLFAGPGQRPSRFFRWRKSLAATCGACGQRRVEAGGPAWPGRREWWPSDQLRALARTGLGSFAAILLAATGWHGAERAPGRAASEEVARVRSEGPGEGRWIFDRPDRPPWSLVRHRDGFGPRGERPFFPPGPPRWAGGPARPGWSVLVWPGHGPASGGGPRGFHPPRKGWPGGLVLGGAGPGRRHPFPAALFWREPLHRYFGPPPVFHFRVEAERPWHGERRTPPAPGRSISEEPRAFFQGLT